MANRSGSKPSKGVPTSQSGPQRALEVLTTQCDQLSESQRAKWADRLVLRFAELEATSEADRTVVDELARIQQAVRDLCEERYETVLEGIRPISRRSVFNHWKQFIKGLVACYRGERDKARALLTGMPEGSAPHNAAKAYLELLGDSDSQSDGGLTQHSLKIVVGTEAAPSILAAERSWQKGSLRSAYERLRKERPGFPSDRLDLDGLLTEFCFKALRLLNERDRNAFLEYLESLENRGKPKNLVESRWAFRTLVLYGKQAFSPDEVEDFWEEFLQVCDRLYGPNPRRRAVAYNWLGELIANISPSLPPFFTIFGGGKNSQWTRPFQSYAQELFERSLKHDPNYLTPHLKLCETYEAMNSQQERNRLLDKMVQRFPENKEVLFKAGQRCVERKAFVKGLDYLERARQADRVDPNIGRVLVEARTRLTAQYFQKQKPEKARSTWEGIRDLLVDQPKEMLQSRWAAYARRGVMEELYGDGDEAEKWLNESETVSPSVAVFSLFVYLARSYYLPSKKRADFQDTRKALMTLPTVSEANILFAVLEFWQAHLKSDPVDTVERCLKEYLSKANRQPFERKELVELVGTVKSGSGFNREVQALVSSRLRTDPEDPYFRLNRMLYKDFRPESLLSKARQDELKSIEEEANRRGDREALDLLSYVRKVTEMVPDLFGSFGIPIDFFDDEDEEEEGPAGRRAGR